MGAIRRVANELADEGVYTTVLKIINRINNGSLGLHFDRERSRPVRIVGLVGYTIGISVYWLLQLHLIVPRRGRYTVYDMRRNRTFDIPCLWQAHHAHWQNYVKQPKVYSHPGFVEVEEGDTVVDVGAYLGQFSLYAADSAARVVAVDPFAAIDSCLHNNLAAAENAVVYPVAAWDSNEALQIQLSQYPSDTSVIEPDVYATGDEVEVPARTVTWICENEGIDQLDFLKVETEGVEPEVLSGALGHEPTKVVVNCGAERYGESPTDEVISLLRDHGYEVEQTVTDGSLGPRVGESPGWDGIEMVFGRRPAE